MIEKQIKGSKKDYKVGNRIATITQVKSNKIDDGGNFYTFDLFDDDGIILAKNRYTYKNSEKQPFDELTEAEELIMNPPIVINEEEMILGGK